MLRSIGTIVALFIIIVLSSSSQGFPVSFISRRRRFNARSTRHLSTLQPCASLFALVAIFSRCYFYYTYSSLIFCEEESVVCSVASIIACWCVFLRWWCSCEKSEKMYEKALCRVHTSLFFQGRFCTRKKVALFIALSSSSRRFSSLFKRKREREREIDICREDNRYYNKSTRRARAQNNETGNT